MNTVHDVKGFVDQYKALLTGNKNGELPGPLVQSQVGLIQQLDLTTTNGLKGYVMKTWSNAFFQTTLRKDLCEQFIVTQLTRDLFRAPAQDYTEVGCPFLHFL